MTASTSTSKHDPQIIGLCFLRDGGELLATWSLAGETWTCPVTDENDFVDVRESLDEVKAGDKWPQADKLGNKLIEVVGGDSEHAARVRTLLHRDTRVPTVLEIRADQVETMRSVPWELMRCGGRYVLQNEMSEIIRVPQAEEQPGAGPRRSGKRLRVLVVSGVTESGNRDAGADTTWERLDEVLDGVGDVRLELPVEPPSAAALADKLAEDPVDLLVFRGHGGPGGLRLTGKRGEETGWANDDTLVRMWRGNVGAVVLLACDAATGRRIVLARQLAAAGIHTVAFQCEMLADEADEFIAGFAGVLRDRRGGAVTLPMAVRGGRRALANVNDVDGAYARAVIWQPASEPFRLLDPSARETQGFLFADLEDRLWVPTPELELELADYGIEIEDPVLVAADGTLIGRQLNGVLELAWVDRQDCSISRRAQPIELPERGEGKVLAVGPSGGGALFVWAGANKETALYRATAGGAVRKVRRLLGAQAGQAVVVGENVMLTVDGVRAQGFDNGRIDRLIAANAGGRTVVLATGTDSAGDPAAWAEVIGRSFGKIRAPQGVLVRPARFRQPPYVLAEDQLVPLDDLPRTPSGQAFPRSRWRPVTKPGPR